MTTPTREASEVLAVADALDAAGFAAAASFATRWHRQRLASISPTPPAVGEGEALIGGGIVFYDRGGWCTRIAGEPFPPTADGYTFVRLTDDHIRALATLRPSPNAIREALETCKRGAMAGLSEFSARQGDRRAPIWHSVNALQDHLSCIIGTCDAALATPEGRTTDKGEGK